MRLVFTLLFAAAAAVAQPNPAVLLHHAFTDGTSGWTMIGQGGNIRAAGGALEFSYEVKPKQFAMAVLPAPP